MKKLRRESKEHTVLKVEWEDLRKPIKISSKRTPVEK